MLLNSANSGSDKFPVGTILPYKGKIADIPKNWALCDGSNETPDLRNRFLEGNLMNEIFEFKEAALPNITGTLGEFTTLGGSYDDGAFYYSSYKRVGFHNGTNHCETYKIDASRCSSIYKNDCNTVQPPAYTVMYIMKIN